MIARRQFITLLGGAAAWPTAALASKKIALTKLGFFTVGLSLSLGGVRNSRESPHEIWHVPFESIDGEMS